MLLQRKPPPNLQNPKDSWKKVFLKTSQEGRRVRQRETEAGFPWLTPIILATQEAQIRRISV
jgi:hypothetical protein